ncbi:MAG TPA: VanZ family protein [Mesorhizobium sp.]|jgi:VanZ family protein|uniref:VanZ family protein n=1 Tax=Mesorhizobium sp. TaxID=1871066 RepID=UPI002DDD34BE|nr:VanZ family protein [Mesorhizobium sp.]HEV2506140.1 VanZ family protein [Mesorhizobium sp.]
MIFLSRLASIFLLALIVFATLSPIGLRPHLGDANLERALAYMLLGSALALSFPRHTIRTAVFVVGIAAVLELLQLIDPGRHGRIEDMAIKAVAGLVGIAAITLAGRLLRRSSMQSR